VHGDIHCSLGWRSHAVITAAVARSVARSVQCAFPTVVVYCRVYEFVRRAVTLITLPAR
jgi:hypothetical protein